MNYENAGQSCSTDVLDIHVEREQEVGKVIKEKFGFIYRILILKKTDWQCEKMLWLVILDSMDMTIYYRLLCVLLYFYFLNCSFRV